MRPPRHMHNMPQETRIEEIQFKTKRRIAPKRSKLTSKRSSIPKRTGLAKRPKKPAKTQIRLWRDWLVPDRAYHRFKGLRGVYWYWLSRQVRREDWQTYGVCITCLEPVQSWIDADCGHILPSSNCGEYLRFYRLNLTLQHKKCNNPRFTPNAGILNTIHMNERHGSGTMETLISLMKKECKEPTTNEYKELITALPSYQEALSLRKDVVE